MSTSPRVDLSLILLAHAPHAAAPHRRASHADAGGEALWSWAAESLLPLLGLLQRLEHEEIQAPISLAISPLLCEMLADIEMVPALSKYLERGRCHAQSHALLFGVRGQSLLRGAAALWEAWYAEAERELSKNPDLLGTLRGLAMRGRIELLATPATLAPLPLLSGSRSIHAQIALARESHQKYFGQAPRGLWLCRGWDEEAKRIARAIEAEGFDFVVEGGPTTHPAEVERDAATRYHASQVPRLRDVLPPLEDGDLPDDFAPSMRGGLGCLRPHGALGEQVWHPSGYAGDERFLHSDRREHPGALRLWRNTGEQAALSQLDAYETAGTAAICEAQAEHWLDRVHEWAQASGNASQCVALDASLLGARWFEGHDWLRRVLRRAASDARFDLRPASHAFTLGSLHSMVAQPSRDAAQSAHDGPTLWRNRLNLEMWPEVARCESQMEHLARVGAGTQNPKLREILDQCARELLLIQSGDWPLLLCAPMEPTRQDDARNRLAAHIETLGCLCSIAETVAQGAFMSEGQRAYLEALRERDDVFADVSFEMWSAG